MKQTTRNRISAVAIAAVLIGGVIYVALPSSPQVTAPTCAASPQAAINALPPGAIFSGTGCYNVGIGLTISKPVIIDGGTYNGATVAGAGSIFKIKQTSGVTIAGVTINGTNTTGHLVYNAAQAGIKLVETTGVTLTNDNINNTGGDCLFIWADPPKVTTPNTELLVDGGTYTRCGRDGISPSDVTNSTIEGVDIVSKGQSGIDAESDIAGIGMGGVTFTGDDIPGVVIHETLSGVTTFKSDAITGRISFRADKEQNYGILFEGGTFAAGTKSNPPIIWQSGTGPNASLTFFATAFTRPNGGQAPLWTLTNHSVLVFADNGTLPDPLGTNDATSTVTMKP